LVNPNYLRFDFSHFSKVSDNEIKQVEDFVNQQIEEQLQLVEHRNIPIQKALEQGAMALFGEKYGDSVRMIEFGESKELCGGIHVKNTADIWHFKIISEGAVAAGIRRIEAITGDAVKDFYNNQENTLAELKETLKNPQDILKSIVSLQDENAKLKKQIEQLLREKAKNLKSELALELQEVNGIKFLAKQVDLNPEGAKDLAYELGNLGDNLFLVLATTDENKPMLTCYISKELVASKNLNAGQVVRELGKYIQGGGGGQPFFATAGGKNVDGIKEALEKAVDFVK
jgi:alanyl-tRNA synthetase